jgi:signal peptidase
MKKVISNIINVILVLVLLLAAGVMVLTGINAKSGKATTVLGYGFMAVQTGSMTPEYPVGSVIIIKETDPSKLSKNDVITFYSSHPQLNDMIVTHRIVDVIDDGDGTYSFTTKGDANTINDEYPAEGEKVIGKVLAKSSLMQKLVNLRQNPATFFVLILLPMCVLIAYEVFTIYKKSTAEKDDKASDNEEKK